jgi:hypothetical protein
MSKEGTRSRTYRELPDAFSWQIRELINFVVVNRWIRVADGTVFIWENEAGDGIVCSISRSGKAMFDSGRPSLNPGNM